MFNVQKRTFVSQLMAFCLLPSNVFILLLILLLSGCLTTSRPHITSQWPLQSESENIYQYYEGEPLPLEEVAILDVRNPLGIVKQVRPMVLAAERDYYYSGQFALKPGKQTIELSYFLTVGATHYSSQSIEVPLDAEKGRLYQTFHIEGYELYQETDDVEDINRFFVEIYDVTDREALFEVARLGRFEAFRREARVMLEEFDAQISEE